jgi:hypothetical protein
MLPSAVRLHLQDTASTAQGDAGKIAKGVKNPFDSEAVGIK